MNLTKSKTQYIDRPPAGWFPLDVMKAEKRKWDWVALMVDVHPGELKHCLCKTAFRYVHPRDYRPDGGRRAQEAWVRVPGKHRNMDAAWDALQGMVQNFENTLFLKVGMTGLHVPRSTRPVLRCTRSAALMTCCNSDFSTTQPGRKNPA
jgi:hypothetical protein